MVRVIKEGRKNLIEIYKIENEELQNIYIENEEYFLYLFEISLKYEKNQLQNERFNPFTGKHFIDTSLVLNKLEHQNDSLDISEAHLLFAQIR